MNNTHTHTHSEKNSTVLKLIELACHPFSVFRDDGDEDEDDDTSLIAKTKSVRTIEDNFSVEQVEDKQAESSIKTFPELEEEEELSPVSNDERRE